MKKLHHIISTKGDLYLTDEEYREFFNLDSSDQDSSDQDSTDYFHTGDYQREQDGSVNLDREYWNRTQSLRTEKVIDFGTGLQY